MAHNKTNMFLRFNKDNTESRDTVSDYLIDLLFKDSSHDFYTDDIHNYYRIYEEEPPENPQYHLEYHLKDHQLDAANNRVLLGHIIQSAPEEMLNYKKNQEWPIVRRKRNALLANSDTQSGINIPDYWSNRTDEYKNSWLTYRQALRDIPQTNENPFTIEWPTAPNTSISGTS